MRRRFALFAFYAGAQGYQVAFLLQAVDLLLLEFLPLGGVAAQDVQQDQEDG